MKKNSIDVQEAAWLPHGGDSMLFTPVQLSFVEKGWVETRKKKKSYKTNNCLSVNVMSNYKLGEKASGYFKGL